MRKLRPVGSIQSLSFQRKHHAGLSPVLSNVTVICEVSNSFVNLLESHLKILIFFRFYNSK